jgi:hypothetical protein
MISLTSIIANLQYAASLDADLAGVGTTTQTADDKKAIKARIATIITVATQDLAATNKAITGHDLPFGQKTDDPEG